MSINEKNIHTSITYKSRLADIKSDVNEISPDEAFALQSEGAVLIDVRESFEVVSGTPRGSIHIPKSFLELKVEEQVSNKAVPVMVMCAGGTRSIFAAEALKKLGYKAVSSISGGFNKWKDRGLEFEIPESLSDVDRARYARHLVMPEVGEAGQLKLMKSRVLLIGAGGIGSPAALYLAAAGIGHIGIVDHDVVDESNLQRQVVHREDRVGTPKVESAKSTIESLNSKVKVEVYQCKIDSTNVDSILKGYNVVVDGSDNFPTRYLINDACIKLGIPNVHGAVNQFEGYVTVFSSKHEGPCYRCLYPDPIPPEFAPNCSEAGVLGVLPGVIGLLESVEALKLILEIGEPLIGKMLCYEALTGRFNTLKIAKNPYCKYCSPEAESDFPDYVDYEQFCAANIA